MDKDEIKVDLKTAIGKIKSSRNRKIFICANNIFESKSNPDGGYDLHGCIPVTAPTAVKWLNDTVGLRDMDEKVWITLAISDYCIFIR